MLGATTNAVAEIPAGLGAVACAAPRDGGRPLAAEAADGDDRALRAAEEGGAAAARSARARAARRRAAARP